MSKFGGTTTFFFEATLRTSVASNPAKARLITENTVVTNSTIETSSTSVTRVRSTALTLTGSRIYTVQFGGLNDGNTYTIYSADVIAEITN